MTETPNRPASRTRVLFDLADELSPEEVRQFEQAATEAGTDITNHFLNNTIRLRFQGPEKPKPAYMSAASYVPAAGIPGLTNLRLASSPTSQPKDEGGDQ